MSSRLAVKSLALQESLIETQQRNQKMLVDMPRGTWCRLCLKNCRDYKSLYDENGCRDSELYDMTTKYFHPIFLTIQKGKKHTVICMECWHKIYEFYHFQNTIVLAQTDLLDKQVEPEQTELSSTRSCVNGFEISLPCGDNDIDTKEGLLHLRDIKVENDLGHDASSVLGIIGSIDDRSSITGSEALAESSHKIRIPNKEPHPMHILSAHSSRNPHNVSMNEEIFDNDFNDTMDMTTMDTDRNNDNEASANENGEQHLTSRELQRKRLDDLIAKWGQPLICSVCKEAIKNYSCLRAHFEEEHSYHDFYIMCCNRKFKTRFHIEEHVQLHINPIGYECDICKATFTAKGALKRHKLHQHFMPKVIKPSRSKKKQYVKTAKDLDAVIGRWKSHLKCVLCNALHPNFEVLRRHFHLEHPKEQCYVLCCQEKLESRWRIAEHARFHMDPKSFRCKFCNKRETSRKTLWDHMQQVHSITVGVKKDEYNCPNCDKIFKTLGALKAHMSTHAIDGGISPPGLRDEDSRSLTKEEYKNETENMHSFDYDSNTSMQPDDTINEYNKYPDHSSFMGEKKVPATRNHKCNFCDESFKSLNTLKAHMDTHTGAGFPTHSTMNQQTTDEYEEPLDVKPFIENLNVQPTETHFMDSKDFPLQYDYMSIASSTINENVCEPEVPIGKYPMELWGSETKEEKTKRLDDLVAQWGQCLECPICKESFVSYSLLREHFDYEHVESSFFIVCCEHKLKTRFHIEEHIRIHLDPTTFKCDICGTTFSARSSFKRHMQHQHGTVRKAIKRTQSKKEANRQRKQYHKGVKELDAIIHRWRPQLQCDLCDAIQPNFEVMRRHFRLEHLNEKCYILCCQRKFETRLQVAEHARFHMDPKKFKCKYCDDKHVSKRQLWDHMYKEHAIQVGERKEATHPNHKCNVCDEVFQSADNLQAHMLTHTVH